MDKIKLAACNLYNNTAEKMDDVHRANISLNFIDKRNTINKLNKTTTPVENDLNMRNKK